jgi:hypothetical protein
MRLYIIKMNKIEIKNKQLIKAYNPLQTLISIATFGFTMANVELIMNSYIAPVYVSAANMITPIATIKLETLYENALIFVNILQIGIETAAFIVKQGIVAAFDNASTINVGSIWTNLTLDKIVYILIVYNLFMLMTIDNLNKRASEQKEKITSLEKNVIYLKKTEGMREDLEQMWIQDVRAYHADTTKKLISINNKMKKLEKQYE